MVPTPSASFNPGVHPTPPSPHPGLGNQDLYFSKIHSQVACTLKLMKPSIIRRPYKIEKGRVIIFILQMGQSRHREMNLSDQRAPCWFHAGLVSRWKLLIFHYFTLIPTDMPNVIRSNSLLLPRNHCPDGVHSSLGHSVWRLP